MWAMIGDRFRLGRDDLYRIPSQLMGRCLIDRDQVFTLIELIPLTGMTGTSAPLTRSDPTAVLLRY